MVGLFARDVPQAFCVQSSSADIDSAGHDFRQMFAYWEDKHIWDYNFCTRVVQNATYRPMRNWAISHEHVMVARATRYMMSVDVGQRQLCQVKTDCIMLSKLAKS